MKKKKRRRERERDREKQQKIKETRDSSKEMMAARLVGRSVVRSFVRSSVSQGSEEEVSKVGAQSEGRVPTVPTISTVGHGPGFRARPGRMCTNYSGISVHLQALCAVAVPAM